MTTKESRQLEYSRKVTSLSSAISSSHRTLNMVDNRIDSVNERVQNLPTRISRVRHQQYRFFRHLEADQTALTETWAKIKPEVQAFTRERTTRLSARLRNLQKGLSHKRKTTNYDVRNISGIESRLSDVQINISELNDYVSDSLNDVHIRFQNIDKDLRIAEHTVNLVSQASFLWKNGEASVLAVKAKDVNNDVKGIITLTNHRIIFEEEQEIVVKKRLFIVTEKKIVRAVVLDQPIGLVHRLTKGRVGLLKGAGIYVEFKPQSGLPEMKLDTKGYEADWMVRLYNFVASGQAEDELTSADAPTQENEIPQNLICPLCGAPYDHEIYRGQTSVQCKYCKAVIPLPS